MALWQTNWVTECLRKRHPDFETEIVKIRTQGEKSPDRAIAEIGVGVFTRELDDALLRGDIDFAVHSMKDVPTELHDDLTIAAILERESPLDVFVSSRGTLLEDLAPGSRVGTGSPRRKAQILARWPKYEIIPLRGNLDTRLRKIKEEALSGTVLAHAGLRRLGKESVITQVIEADAILPAVGQGAVGVCVRKECPDILALLSEIEDEKTRCCVEAERSFLRKLRGGCQVPAGALATVGAGESLRLEAVIAALDGRAVVRGSRDGEVSNRVEIGLALAVELLDRGGEEILSQLRGA